MKTSFPADPTRPLDCLFVGSPGSAKTSVALQFPGVYIMDCDNNLTPAVNYTGIRDFKYDVAHYDDDGNFVEPAKRYELMVKRLTTAYKDPAIRTIVIDSMSSLVDIIISECKRLGGLADNALMRIQDWGTFAYILRNLIIKLKTCGKHFILTAHHKLEKDEGDNTFKSLLNVPGQAQFTLSGLFSNVWLFYYGDPEGVGTTAKNNLRVRTIPQNKNDFRGLKGGLGDKLKADQKVDDIIKLIPSIAQ